MLLCKQTGKKRRKKIEKKKENAETIIHDDLFLLSKSIQSHGYTILQHLYLFIRKKDFH